MVRGLALAKIRRSKAKRPLVRVVALNSRLGLQVKTVELRATGLLVVWRGKALMTTARKRGVKAAELVAMFSKEIQGKTVGHLRWLDQMDWMTAVLLNRFSNTSVGRRIPLVGRKSKAAMLLIKSTMWIKTIFKRLGQMSRSGLIKRRRIKRGQLPQNRM